MLHLILDLPVGEEKSGYDVLDFRLNPLKIVQCCSYSYSLRFDIYLFLDLSAASYPRI